MRIKGAYVQGCTRIRGEEEGSIQRVWSLYPPQTSLHPNQTTPPSLPRFSNPVSKGVQSLFGGQKPKQEQSDTNKPWLLW